MLHPVRIAALILGGALIFAGLLAQYRLNSQQARRMSQRKATPLPVLQTMTPSEPGPALKKVPES